MQYDAIWINNVFLGIIYKKGSFIPLGIIKFCFTKRHPITGILLQAGMQVNWHRTS